MYSISQGVLEQWVFTESSLDNWTCINGGMDRITNGMLQIIKSKPMMNTSVPGILPASNGQLTLDFNNGSIQSTCGPVKPSIRRYDPIEYAS